MKSAVQHKFLFFFFSKSVPIPERREDCVCGLDLGVFFCVRNEHRCCDIAS